IRDVRSVWGPGLDLPMGAVTVLVGPNRSGSSSVLFALAAAAGDAVSFDPGRDVPHGRDAAPSVTVVRADGSRSTCTWDVATGVRHVEGGSPSGVPDSPAGAVVYAETHHTPRDLVRRSPLDLSDRLRRERLGAHVRVLARRVIPEVSAVEVAPDGRVDIRDDNGAQLPVPSTRVLFALGLAQHLASTSTPVSLVAVAAPEAFLHPAAQEDLAAVLVDVARETCAPVVVATTSPFVVPRHEDVWVVSLARDAEGRTRLVGAAPGDRPQARLLGGLLRDQGLAEVLDRIGRVPAGTRAVLVVEGGTDEAYLRTVAGCLGRTGVLDDVVISVAGGAMAAAMAAIVLRAELDLPVVVLLDHDVAGRRARDTLVSRFAFDRSREVVTYADVFDGNPPGVEAETLFDQDLLRRFVVERAGSVTSGERTEDGVTTVELTGSGKSAFVGWLDEHVCAEHLARWDALLDLLAHRLGR
ncbi:MAG: hypothetical protein WD575_03365, partial [Nitriliruptoraceae bacterium]